MKLSFIIPAHNEEETIGKCLDSIIRELRKGGASESEIIVVNNASTDRTGEIAKNYPGVTVVDEPKKGIVFAREAGFKKSTGELVAHIDADTMLTVGWIEKVLKEFSRNPHLVCVSGPFIYYDLSPLARFWVKIFYSFGFLSYLVNRFIFRSSSMVQGGNFVCRREALLKAGGFDTTIDFYGEDTDIARRLTRVGAVKWTFNLPIYTSGRRLKEEGILATGARYAINYFWVTFLGKPFTKRSRDIRPKNK